MHFEVLELEDNDITRHLKIEIMNIKSLLIQSSLLVVFSTSHMYGQQSQKNNAPLSKNAPKDAPAEIKENELSKFDKQIAPYVKQARATLPNAKKRYLKGLGKGEAFFLTIRLHDTNGQWEQIFIRVEQWQNDKIKGYIDSELLRLKEYRQGQHIEFTESKILDWLITKPDGKEEGNFVGKYLDTQHQ